MRSGEKARIRIREDNRPGRLSASHSIRAAPQSQQQQRGRVLLLFIARRACSRVFDGNARAASEI